RCPARQSAAYGSPRGPWTGRRRPGRGCSRQVPGEGQAGPEQETSAVRRARRHVAVEEPDSLADPDEAVSAAAAAVRGTAPVVAYLDAQLIGSVVQQNRGLGGVGMLEHVGETLLDDPVGGDVGTAGKGEPVTGDAQLNAQHGAFDVLDKPVEAVEPRLRRQLGSPAVITHRVQQV